ncbi:efflux RND transporter periplasmic adaptor subunit [Pseudodesulfovibrio thermohalotolerans]|uniref:efflux RND transporter periplasmic adaptor subunit n=1 Tax=Pseudodesulfovibrio thermohalotolerans TaxID=2880651 RepID=UPI002441C666|nr:efflux RND transporter periplasmic adaptor subunit [Pseudodesulfovibrio thermohalotolerans]WFS64214.1 efflux RND transporter periplasmic adaptor subunit [Pseudodesulfovibrio thermohalotolerans]
MAPYGVMNNTARFKLLSTLLLAVLLLGCNGDADTAMPAPTSRQVSTITIHRQKVTLTRELSGRTTPFRIAEIRPRISGLIQRRLFTEGSDVKEGEILYLIDPAPFQAEYNNALAGLKQAQAQLQSVGSKAERYEKLLEAKTVSQQDYDDAASALNELNARIRSLQASLEVARINLGYTKITAPIPGRIGKSSVTDGAIVTAYQNTALTSIQQLDPIYVDVPQSTTELLRIRNGVGKGKFKSNSQHPAVQLILEDDALYPHEGRLQFSDVTVDQTTGTVTLRAIFPNPDKTLLPGMFVKAVLQEGVDEQALLIPQQGVSRDHRGEPFAMVVDEGSKAQRRPLVLGRAIGDKWLVISGLAPGDRVIVEGLQRLQPGTEVTASPFDSPKDPPADAQPRKSRPGEE